MPQDAYTLKYLCNELNELLSNGKINRIVQPDNDQIILTVYTGKETKKLLIDVNPASPRIGIITEDRECPLTAPNFCMLLRKHLLNATINEISLEGYDRIVKIDLTSYGEFIDSVPKTLYVELMGRYSNAILTENGKVLGGNRGINNFDQGIRPLIVGRNYVFPPSNNKLEPLDKNVIEYLAKYDISQGLSLCDYIVNGVQGVAKSTAMQLIYEYQNKTNLSEENVLNNVQEFYQFMVEFLYESKPNPCVQISNGKVKDVFVKPYDFTGEISDLKFFNKLHLAEQFYFEKKQSQKKFEDAKLRAINLINSAVKKAKKRLSAVLSKEKDALDLDKDKLFGELIISNVYRLKKGEQKARLENWYDDNKIVEIVLDESLSPSQNAEKFFKRYNKKKRTLEALESQKDMAKKELDYLLSVQMEAELAESITEAQMVLEELAEQGIIKQNNSKRKKKKDDVVSCREYLIDGFSVKIGRNNTENDRVTFTAKGDSIWLHSKDYHSSHAIIESSGNGKDVPQKVIEIVAEICAYYSKGRDGGKTEIVYTKRKNVKKPPKSKPGFCVYDNFSSVMVLPNKHEEFLKA